MKPTVEISGYGPHLRMWIATRQVGVQVARYGASEPNLVPLYASQWVCDCGARGTPKRFRQRLRYSKNITGYLGIPIAQLVSDWARHAKRHIKRRHLQLELPEAIKTGRWATTFPITEIRGNR